MSEAARWTCDCGRGPVVAFVGATPSSFIVRRFQDVPHRSPSDGKCADCVADLAIEVGSFRRANEEAAR